MRLTIIKDDNCVVKDSVAVNVTDVSYVPANVHAVQWYDSKGEVEYNDGTANLEITELGIYAQASTDHQAALDAEAASLKAAEDAINWTENFKSVRNEKLKNSDWTRLDDITLTSDKKTAWATYRQALRDLPTTKSGTDKELAENVNHSDWPTQPS